MIKRTRYPKEFREALVAEISLGQSMSAQASKRENIARQNRLRAAGNCSAGAKN
jgi:transposase-like protein